jgi:Cytochrome P450
MLARMLELDPTPEEVDAIGTLALLEHPDQLDWLAHHPDRCTQAVDELLRYDSPVQIASRVARNNLILGGVNVRKGQQALVVLGAANRDPARYPDPDRLDLTHTGQPHLAFGNGPHFCVGAGLARLEAQETFNHLAQSALRSRANSWSHAREPSRTFRRLRNLHVADNQTREQESARRKNSRRAVSQLVSCAVQPCIPNATSESSHVASNAVIAVTAPLVIVGVVEFFEA